MPLLKGSSGKIFEHNIEVERKAGKPMKQSLAIAYAMKKKKKKMADGGQVTPGQPTPPTLPGAQSAQDSMRKAFNFSKGGAVAEDDKDLNQHPVMTKEDMYDDLVDRIMMHKSQDYSNEARLSEGGMIGNEVDIDSADHMPAQYDDLVLNDNLESHYTGENSGDEIGDEQEDEDRKSIVSRIMKSNRKKDRNPRPA